jgi:hypothetical protein
MAEMPLMDLILRSHGLLNSDFPWRVLHLPSRSIVQLVPLVGTRTIQYITTHKYNQPDALSYEWGASARCKLHIRFLLALGTPALYTCEQTVIITVDCTVALVLN